MKLAKLLASVFILSSGAMTQTYPHLFVTKRNSETSPPYLYDYDSVPHPFDTARVRAIVHDTSLNIRAAMRDTSSTLRSLISARGTVSSVGLSVPAGFTAAGTPVTSSGTLSFSANSQYSGYFYASPPGANGTPNFRRIDVLDLPASGVAAGSYGSASYAVVQTVDDRGRVTSLSTTPIAAAWGSVTGKPTTISGYGITDAQPLDADLTAISALSTTSFGRSLLTQADAEATRGAIGAAAPLGYVPVNKAGDAMTGALSVGAGASAYSLSVRDPSSTIQTINYLHSSSGNLRLITRFDESADAFDVVTRNDDGTARNVSLRIPRATATAVTAGGSGGQPWNFTGGVWTGGSQRISASGTATVSSLYNSAWVGAGPRPILTDASGMGYATDATSFRSAINAGTVSSVGLTPPANMAVTGSPVTASGSLALSWNGSSTSLVKADGATVPVSNFQTALTNPVTGIGNALYLPMWTSSSTLGYASKFAIDNSTGVLSVASPGDVRVNNSYAIPSALVGDNQINIRNVTNVALPWTRIRATTSSAGTGNTIQVDAPNASDGRASLHVTGKVTSGLGFAFSGSNLLDLSAAGAMLPDAQIGTMVMAFNTSASDRTLSASSGTLIISRDGVGNSHEEADVTVPRGGWILVRVTSSRWVATGPI